MPFIQVKMTNLKKCVTMTLEYFVEMIWLWNFFMRQYLKRIHLLLKCLKNGFPKYTLLHNFFLNILFQLHTSFFLFKLLDVLNYACKYANLYIICNFRNFKIAWRPSFTIILFKNFTKQITRWLEKNIYKNEKTIVRII